MAEKFTKKSLTQLPQYKGVRDIMQKHRNGLTPLVHFQAYYDSEKPDFSDLDPTMESGFDMTEASIRADELKNSISEKVEKGKLLKDEQERLKRNPLEDAESTLIKKVITIAKEVFPSSTKVEK